MSSRQPHAPPAKKSTPNPMPTPKMSAKGKDWRFEEVPLAQIFYMQHSVSEDFSHHSRYRTIDEMARAIEDAGGDVGAVITDPVLDRISVIPRGENEYFSLDHRRLVAYKWALPRGARVPVWVYCGAGSGKFFEGDKYSTCTRGRSVVVLPKGTKRYIDERYRRRDQMGVEMRTIPWVPAMGSVTLQQLHEWRGRFYLWDLNFEADVYGDAFLGLYGSQKDVIAAAAGISAVLETRQTMGEPKQTMGEEEEEEWSSDTNLDLELPLQLRKNPRTRSPRSRTRTGVQFTSGQESNSHRTRTGVQVTEEWSSDTDLRFGPFTEEWSSDNSHRAKMVKIGFRDVDSYNAEFFAFVPENADLSGNEIDSEIKKYWPEYACIAWVERDGARAQVAGEFIFQEGDIVLVDNL